MDCLIIVEEAMVDLKATIIDRGIVGIERFERCTEDIIVIFIFSRQHLVEELRSRIQHCVFGDLSESLQILWVQ